MTPLIYFYIQFTCFFSEQTNTAVFVTKDVDDEFKISVTAMSLTSYHLIIWQDLGLGFWYHHIILDALRDIPQK